MLVIDSGKCIRCGLCLLLCPTDAIQEYQIANELCIQCGECRKNCSETAVDAVSQI
jgi:uncharacterized protein